MSALSVKQLEMVETKPAEAGGEHRDAKRWPFIASIEFFDLERGGSVISGRTSDLSSGGCYVDCMSPIPLNSQFRVRIEHSGKVMEAVGTVVYSQPGNGLGISFTYMAVQDQRILNQWLRDLRGESSPVPVDVQGASGTQFERSEREVLAELVSLLLKRGVLTVGDGNRLLRELSSYCQASR